MNTEGRVCVLSSYIVAHQHPLSHIFRDATAAFSKHRSRGLAARSTANTTVTSEAGQLIDPFLLTSWLSLTSPWIGTVLVKMSAWCSQTISLWYGSYSGRVGEKLLDKHRQDCTGTTLQEARNISAHITDYFMMLYSEVYSLSPCATLAFFI